jgi:26S proteasome subunit P45 family
VVVGHETKLKVAEAIQDDVNKGIVRLDSSYMRDLDIRPGNIVEIKGERATVAIADRSLPGDIGLNIIRMDGLIRRNAKSAIGEQVKVRKAEVHEAKRITIAPARSGIMIRASPQIFKRGLLGRAVVKGDIVGLGGTTRRRNAMSDNPFFNDMDLFTGPFTDFNFGLGDLKFIVVDVQPTKKAVLITESTDVIFNPEAVELKEEERGIDVSYEDIGGLDEEVSKVREMVELPLKHPEIFERLGIEPPKGVLLHGPPGTGKTLLAKAVANETHSNFLLINGPEIMCVTGDAQIFTNPRGYVEARQIYHGAKGKKQRLSGIDVIRLEKPLKTFAFTHDTIEPAHITHVARLEAESYRVKLGDGNEVIGSQNQPFLVYEDGALGWKRLENLTADEYVARINKVRLPATSQQLGTEHLVARDGRYAVPGRNESRSVWVRLPRRTNPAVLEWLGLVVAEGYVAADGITFANNDERLRRRFATLTNKLFGIAPKKTYTDGRVVIYSTALVHWLTQFGLAPGKKHLAVWPGLYRCPVEEAAAFVTGYFDGDGTVSMTNGYPTPILYSTSRPFLKQLQGLLMLKLGIPTKLLPHPTPKGLMQKLVVRGHAGRQRFAALVKPVSVEKRRRLEQLPSRGREWENIPTPKLLLAAVRSKAPYSAYRNLDYYVYENGRFTRHALTRLFAIAQRCRIVDDAVQREYDLLMRTDIAWERILAIEEAGRQELFDFTVDKDSFTAEPYLLLHNSKYYGQSEENLRKKFEDAEKNAPSIIFIDEIDAIASKREESKGEVERRVVAQLLAIMDGLKSRGKVVVIAATNIPNSLDPALRRPGRFDREIEIGVPGVAGRLNILKIHTRNMPLDKDVDLKRLSEVTHGFVGADLASLAKEAAMIVLRRVLPDMHLKEDEEIPKEVLEKLFIHQQDFIDALKVVRPSAMREVLIQVPNVKWIDVGGLDDVKQELMEAVEWPLKHKEAFTRLGVKPPKGVLLYGPPGTGKTMLAKAVATETEANFILVKGPEMLSKWVGESEKAVRKIFEKARQTAPTIIFFDEVDAIAPRRGANDGSDSHVTERVVNQLLTEMDGLQDLNDVVIVAATNRPDIIDTALLRPGRFDRIVFVPVPDKKTRKQIFQIHTKGMALDKDIDLDELTEKTEGYVGADIESVCREAAILALRKDMKAKTVKMEFFKEALQKVRPSTTKEIEDAYRELEEHFRTAQGARFKEEKPSYYG